MKTLYLVCGIPGSGKSTYIKEHNKNGIWVSRDNVRFAMLKDEEDYFSHETEVFNRFCHLINVALASSEEVYADATHLNEKARNKVLDRLDLAGVNIIPISFELPLGTCLKFNSKRKGRAYVPENVIMDMHKKYSAPTTNEKYKYASIIKVKEVINYGE